MLLLLLFSSFSPCSFQIRCGGCSSVPLGWVRVKSWEWRFHEDRKRAARFHLRQRMSSRAASTRQRIWRLKGPADGSCSCWRGQGPRGHGRVAHSRSIRHATFTRQNWPTSHGWTDAEANWAWGRLYCACGRGYTPVKYW
ncbi:hypothetical protein HDK77DRAFT_179544 [Phyllosticta capitalensis]